MVLDGEIRHHSYNSSTRSYEKRCLRCPSVMLSMQGSTALVYVDLSNNKIRRMPMMKLLAKYLRNNSSLIGLDLRFNKLPTKSADVLMKALKKNTTLEDLCLANNNIGDKSVESFTDMLQNNSTLNRTPGTGPYMGQTFDRPTSGHCTSVGNHPQIKSGGVLESSSLALCDCTTSQTPIS